MKINIKTFVFYSNFLNHHQLPFCNEMVKKLGKGFSFVSTEPIHEERLKMGYADINKEYPFVVRSYENDDQLKKAIRLGEESDVVIIGSAPEYFVKKRIIENKLTFRYSERIFKKGRWRIIHPIIIKNLILKHTRYYNKRLYMLCASAYTEGDFSMVWAYKNKCYKWGYFPEVKESDIDILIKKKNDSQINILWAGRFLEWKHPEKALHVAKFLREKKINFKLFFIGGGEMDLKLKIMTDKYNLKTSVEFLGYQSPAVVREYMDISDIFLFTSNYQEGWGAVLNEAMNSACAVVCSNAIGSVSYLVKDKVNGLIYKNNDMNDLMNKVLLLAKNKYLREEYGINAYKTIVNLWNANIACDRLLGLSESLLMGNKIYNKYSDGPCSLE